jgi:hypothetical protein
MKTMSKSLTHAIVGMEAGKKKLETFQMNQNITLIDENGLFEMIRTLPGQEVADNPPHGPDFGGIPMCKYGNDCYRNNPQHFQQFAHPPGFTKKQGQRS